MKFDIIATGSTGNAVVINDSIMVDCGVSFKALDLFKKNIKLVLLTHIHGDHFKPRTVWSLHRERPTLRWGCCEWMVRPLLEAGVNKRVIDVIHPDSPGMTTQALCYNGLAIVSPVALPHDVPNCGWHIFCGKESFFYATDTANLDGVNAPGYDLYLIEANYNQNEMENRIKAKMEAGEFAYESRAMTTHLSKEQAEEWLYQNMDKHSKYVFLHQHKEKK